MAEFSWSDWLDFNLEHIAKVPEYPGVFMMHAAMKILYIGNSDNLRKAIGDLVNTVCVCDAKRFRFAIIDNHDQVKETLLAEYKEKHDGKMPLCM